MKLIISLFFAASLARATTYDLSLLVVDETITPVLNNTSWVASNPSSAAWTGTVVNNPNPVLGRSIDPLFTYSSPSSPCGGFGDNVFSFGAAPGVVDTFTGSTAESINFDGCTEIFVITELGVPFDIQTLTHGTPAIPAQLAIIYFADSAVPETETLEMSGIGLTLIGLLAAKRARILTAQWKSE